MMRVRTTVKPSSIHGFGCFADAPISAGELVWQYVAGFDQEDPLTLYDYPDNARFINHSIVPNTEPTTDGNTRAMQAIPSGTEITENYYQTVPALIGELGI